VREGVPTPTVPVRLAIEGVYPETQVLEYYMAYHTTATMVLKGILQTRLSQLALPREMKSRVDVEVVIREPVATVRWTDSPGYGLTSLEKLLDAFIRQERETIDVASVNIRFRPVEGLDLWEIQNIHGKGRKSKGEVAFLAQRERDKGIAQMTRPFNASVFWENREKPFKWMDGSSIPNLLFGLMPARSVLKYLSAIEDREALYLVYLESDKQLKVNRKISSNDWTVRVPEVIISASVKVENAKLKIAESEGVAYTRFR
jgi:hypothetical protein